MRKPLGDGNRLRPVTCANSAAMSSLSSCDPWSAGRMVEVRSPCTHFRSTARRCGVIDCGVHGSIPSSGASPRRQQLKGCKPDPQRSLGKHLNDFRCTVPRLANQCARSPIRNAPDCRRAVPPAPAIFRRRQEAAVNRRRGHPAIPATAPRAAGTNAICTGGSSRRSLLSMRDPGPIHGQIEMGAVLVIVAADALIRGSAGKRRPHARIDRMTQRRSVTILATNIDARHPGMDRIKSIRQTVAGRVTLLAIWIDLESASRQLFPGVRMTGCGPCARLLRMALRAGIASGHAIRVRRV